MRRQLRIAIGTLGLALTAVAALAAPPKLITVQGKVTDAAGAPLPAGVKLFAFRIYSANPGGTQIWPSLSSEVQNISSDADGLWSGALGAVIPLTDVVFADSVRWLEMTVSGQVLPRVRLVTGPYAMRVATVDGASGGRVSGKITSAGIGDGVEIQGPGIGNVNQAYILFSDQAETQLGYVGDGSGVSQDMDVASYVGNVHLYTPAGAVLTAHSSGNVGIGGATPSSSEKFVVGHSGVELFNVRTDGLVGIGSAFFGYRLGVQALSGQGGILAVGGLGGTGTYSYATGAGSVGIHGSNPGGGGLAGKFSGNVDVEGTLTKDAGSFKIDHPLDPANKYLSHSFVESPDMMNIYNGNATLDALGEAAVTLPDWFGALNKDFRYQLTAIGAPGPNLYIAQEVTNNQFRIAGGEPGTKVSWMVTGIRQDAYANAHRIPVEETKPDKERGYYRHPELFSQPEENGIDWARHPEMMKQMKEEREKGNPESEQ